ncbi:hypothetical protein RDI58_000630 [Solanum bulbocastanum]|uniref:Uncharacterized protein n=1 Tax=Solanum bulbocastanum TaxID=147425 RepID=A0AAN8YPB8_SOLBU
MEEDKRKSPRRSPRIHSDGGTSNQKVYRRSRMRGQVSSPTAMDDVNDGPNFSLGISQVSGEQNKEQNKKHNKDGSEKKKPVKDAKTRNRLPKNVILPESRYPDRKFWKHPDVVYIASRWSSYTNHSVIDQIKLSLSDLPKASTQLQVIHCLINRELKHTPDDVFAIEINNKKLFFGLREFGIVIGLNCVSDGTPINVPYSKCSLLSSYFSEKTLFQRVIYVRCF